MPPYVQRQMLHEALYYRHMGWNELAMEILYEVIASLDQPVPKHGKRKRRRRSFANDATQAR